MFSSKIKKCVVLLALSVPFSQPLYAEMWKPKESIKIVVPFSAGGTTDILGRLLAENMSKHYDATVIVENTPGANGNIGAASVARSKPDGYTLLLGTPGPLIVNKYVYPQLNYDPKTAFENVGLIAALPNVLMIKPDLGVNSVQELIELAKTEKDYLTHGSPGVGSSGHVSTELFKSQAGIEAVHVPYQGSVPMLTDLMAGSTDFTIDQISSALAFLNSGKLKPLAVTSSERSKSLPDIPTLKESGLPNYAVSVWFALAAPAGTPENIVTSLNSALNEALNAPSVKEKLASYGAEEKPGTPQDMQAQRDAEEKIIQTVTSTVDLRS